jgi:endonuclease-3 related protein
VLDASLLRELARRLDRALGPQHWWPARTPFEVMVGAVLTQNTNWKNVERAIDNLRRRGALSLKELLRLKRSTLSALIRPAGYYRLKARRLLSLCRWLDERCAGRLQRLRRVETERLRGELLSVHGVGPETADSILLYALDRPVFVVDAYTRRVLARHGVARGDEPYEVVRASFERALGPRRASVRYNELHAQIVMTAKRWCRTTPACEGCPLGGWNGFG